MTCIDFKRTFNVHNNNKPDEHPVYQNQHQQFSCKQEQQQQWTRSKVESCK